MSILNIESVGVDPRTWSLERVLKSPNYKDGKFINPIPTKGNPDNMGNVMWRFLTENKDIRRPSKTIPLVNIPKSTWSGAPSQSIKVWWLGHASSIVEMEGHRFLLDPVFGKRASMFDFVGPERLHPVPLNPQDLPEFDAFILSHNHYDHLDFPTIKSIGHKAKLFIVPLGVGSTLEYWGIPKEKIIEMDWWDKVEIGNLEIAATPARHFTGRGLMDRNNTLWASYCFKGTKEKFFFSGDSGEMPQFEDIGKAYGPFDLALMAIGAADPAWHDIHLNPEEATVASLQIKAKKVIPIHWATFDLALHSWADPIDRFVADTKKKGVPIFTPKIGELIESKDSTIVTDWWTAVK